MAGSRRAPPRVLLSIVTVVLGAVLLVLAIGWWILRTGDDSAADQWDAFVTTVAGSGVAGVRDGDRFHARFSDPFGIAAGADGAMYVADAGKAQRIRRVARDGTVSTVAGGERGFADGPAASARFDTPSGIAVDPDGAIYVADTANNAIRRLTPDGMVSTLAGGGIGGYADGVGRAARLNGPLAVAIDPALRVIVADTYNDRIRAVERDGRVVTVAGDGRPGHQDGTASEARFNTPSGVAVDTQGNIYVADTGNDAIRVISRAGVVSTLWSLPPGGLYRPTGIAVGGAAALYVTDQRGRVAEINHDAGSRVLAGSGPGFADGDAREARFRAPSGVAFLGPRRLAVADRRNGSVRLIAARSQLEFRAPGPPRPGAPDRLRLPMLWPFAPFEGPFEITGTFGEARGAAAERLHTGVDIHGPEGRTVHAVRPGVVSDPIAVAGLDTLSESVRVGTLTYVHLRVGRERRAAFEDSRFVRTYDGDRLVQLRVRRGARFDRGDPIGTVNRFSHVHLNVGWPGEEINPLEVGLVQFADTIPPTIVRGGIRLFRDDGQPLTDRSKGRVVVSGRVRIVVDAWDQVNGNARRRRLGLYRLGYHIRHADGTPAPGFERPLETIRFDRMAPESETSGLIYALGSGIPEFGLRRTRFLYIVTNMFKGGIAGTGVWDSDALAPGNYVLRVLAADISGNEAVANRDLPITIPPGQ